MVFLVPCDCYSLLLGKLKEDSLPRTAFLQGLLHNTIKGAVSANFYTDSWPKFSVLVCEQISPRLCDKSHLHCYTTCKKDLCEVLVKGNLLSLDGQSQIFLCDKKLTEHLTQYLIDSLSVNPTIFEEVSFYYLPIEAKSTLDTVQCPEGYRLGKLEPCHTELVASSWDVLDSSHKISWMAERIKNLTTVAAFATEDPSQPVAWVLLYANMEIGSLYTLEAHRKKGLGSAVTAALCRSCLEECPDLPPYALIGEDVAASVQLFKKLGFVGTNYKFNFLITKLL